MFGRIAACGIAAFLQLSLVPASGVTSAFADGNAPAVVIATTQDQAQNQSPNQAPEGAQEQARVAALDPAQPSSKSPMVTGPAIQLTELFGLKTLPVTSGDVLTKWNGVEAGIRAERETLARCRDDTEPCPPAAQNFLAIIAQGRARNGRARIGVINRAINLAIQPMSDLAQWGVPDRWSAPLDTLSTGRGDCEDYAIAKYVALREAGVADADVRLVIVHDLAAGEDHAITAARLDGNWIMLDNRWLTLVADSEVRRVIPLFALDDDGVKQFAPAIIPGARPATAPPGHGAASAPAALGF